MEIALYVAYAFIQAIFVVRALQERTAPGLLVCLFALGAPLVSVLVLLSAASRFIHWAVTFKNT